MGNIYNSLSSNYTSSSKFSLQFRRSVLQTVIVIGQKDRFNDTKSIGGSGDQ